MRALCRLIVPAVLAALALGGSVRAQDLARLDTSLKHVPADASFYTTSLRLGEQLDRFLASNAYERLRDLPAVKTALEHLRKETAKPDNPMGKFLKQLEEPANRELVDLLHDMVRGEIFAYGGSNWGQVIPVLQEIQGAQQ